MEDNDDVENIILEWNILLISYYHKFNIQNKNIHNSEKNIKLQKIKKPRKKDFFLLNMNYYLLNNDKQEYSELYKVKRSDFDLRKETIHKLAKKHFPFLVEFNLDFRTTYLYRKNNSVIISIILDKTKNTMCEYDNILKSLHYSLYFSKKLFVDYKKCIILNNKTPYKKYNILKGLLDCYLNNDYLITNIIISKNLNNSVIFSLEEILKTIKPYFWINKVV